MRLPPAAAGRPNCRPGAASRASGPVRGEGHRRRERRESVRGHDESIEAERDARAFRQPVSERGEEALVERIADLAVGLAHVQIVLETPALFQRIAELAESVRELGIVLRQIGYLSD